MSEEQIRILLADDHALVRAGLALVIGNALEQAEIVETRDYGETLEKLSEDSSIDLLLIDLKMPGMEGFDGIENICKEHPDVPLAVISVEENTSTIRHVLELGAVGYIPKTSSPNVTTSAIQLILSGGVYVPPHVLNRPRGADDAPSEIFPEDPVGQPREPDAKMLGVTPRQKDVLDLLASGMTNKDIAARLGLTPGTVKMHTSRIFKLLGVSNRTEAVARYTQMVRDLERA